MSRETLVGAPPATGCPRIIPRKHRRWAWVGAAAAGVTLFSAFPPLGWWPLAPLGVAVLTAVSWRRPPRLGAALGLVAGLALMLPLLQWLRRAGPDAWLVLAAVQALYFAPLGAGLALVSRLRAWPLWSAALWVAEELVRDRFPLGGFPWGRLAFSQAGSPLAAYAFLGGAPLVTFATALAGTLLAAVAGAALRRPAWRRGVVALAALAALMATAAVIPLLGGGRWVSAAVVQGNVPRLGLDFLGQRAAVLDNHVRATHHLAQAVREGRLPRPDLVVWPENSTDIDPYRDPEAARLISGAVADVGVPVLVGAVVENAAGTHLENRGIVWDPRSGPGAFYVKRHPVPFGEYVPFRSLLSRFITRLDRVPLDFAAGSRPGVLRLGPATLAEVICFEVAYDEVVRDAVTGGGQLITVQTNNATFGRTGESQQQLAMGRIRAIEHGRAVLIAATSGISAVITPQGQVAARSGEFTPALLVARVPLRTTLTPADQVGAAPEWAISALGCVAALTAAGLRHFQRRRTRRIDDMEATAA